MEQGPLRKEARAKQSFTDFNGVCFQPACSSLQNQEMDA